MSASTHNSSDRCRRPIEDAERAELEALGRALADERRLAGLSIRQLAAASLLSPAQLSRIERGLRRTRFSTLERIADALDQPELLEEWTQLVGAGLAAESLYAERIARRRERRFRSQQNRAGSRARARSLAAVRARHQQEGARQRAICVAQSVYARADPLDLDATEAAFGNLMRAMEPR
jgi:transcriptional regulator with XRE-family HTH domain